MRKLAVILLASLAVGGPLAASGSAADTIIALTPTGMQPDAVTIQWGETVTFTNADTIPHAIVIPRVPFTSDTILPGAHFPYTFAGRAGRYNVRQAGGRSANATVVVELSGEVTLEEPAEVLPYGQELVLRGTSGVLGHPVAIEQRVAGEEGWRQVATSDPATGGAFEARLTPTPGARYRATAAAGQLRSGQVSIQIEPVISLRASSRSTATGAVVIFTARLRPAEAARQAVLEAYDARRKRWLTVATGRISSTGTVRFRWRAAAGRTMLRAAVERRGLATGFTSVASRPVTVRAS